ncbi:helix-turn-helix domain-containing protein [Micromonospora sp. WMMD1274]|uniref:helix-turn-helix domain-containing protein n=1 Tax=Micromonospora sp. WMMD1274 TaxID=3404116 RepID=UPI003B934CFE
MSTRSLTLSDVAADQIVRLRKRLNLTREQLAARCAELGYPALTGPALANIETGRRKGDGVRRRDVSVDELAVLAQALQVPPLLLLFPVGVTESVDVLPSRSFDTWWAAKWFTGEANLGDDTEDQQFGVPLYLFRRHDRLLDDYLGHMTDQLFPPEGQDEDARKMLAARALSRLRDVRGEMRRHGLTPPSLPEDLRHVDDRWHVYRTPEQMEAYAAEHPGDARFVDSSRPGAGRIVQPGDAQRIRRAQQAWKAEIEKDEGGVND